MLRAETSGRTPTSDIERWKQEIEAPDENVGSYFGRMVRGATLSHRDWLGLNNERHMMRRTFNAFFNDWDILLCPVAASAAFPHDHDGERWQRKIIVNGNSVPTTDQLFWAGYSGLMLLPSTVGPASLCNDGLPVGYQAIAGSGCDKIAIAFSRYVEREIGGFFPPPDYDD